MCCYGRGENKSARICNSDGHKGNEVFKQQNTAHKSKEMPLAKIWIPIHQIKNQILNIFALCHRNLDTSRVVRN